MTPSEIERRLAAILSADAVGYSRLMAEDEASTVEAITAHRDEIQRLVDAHGGRVVDAPGDNLLAEFPTATGAVQCALEIQRTLADRNAELSPDRRMEHRGATRGARAPGGDLYLGRSASPADREGGARLRRSR
jgi:class 3 adenylate cyclase